MKGCFFALEGIDGSGKSTQLALLLRRLEEAGIPCSGACEPTDGPIGRLLRDILAGRVRCDPRTAAPLFAADRLDHLLNEENGLCRAVERGTTVVCDRYYFSSYAYQSVDLPMEQVIAVNRPCADLLRPTATLFLDVDPELALERIARSRSSTELFETRERLVRTRAQFFRAFALLEQSERVVVIPGDRGVEAVSQHIWDQVSRFFPGL